ncbi:MAG: ATPase, T2SS/T4P/T4SS family [Candidatus Tectomicrobia bacterium]|nr:ATPase, T2SS/T4P/T4SS family [Candidatus Tectomicrobia bacterium]
MDQLDNISGEHQVATAIDSSCELKTRKSKLISKIHTIRNLDDFFFEVRDEIHNLFDAEQATIYAVDREKRELYSKFTLDPLDGVQEIRVPISQESISGYCARYGKLVNVVDAYDDEELATLSSRLTFDRSWDERTGFRTRQVLSVPILFERKYLMGVLVLLNRKTEGKFSKSEEEQALEIAEILGMAFRNQQQSSKRRRPVVKSKYDYLLQHKLISKDDLDSAITEARRKGQDVETVLIEEYRLPKKEVGESLSQYYGCPFLEFDERSVTDPSLLKGISFDYLKNNYWVPLRREDSTVDILVDDPKDLQKIEHIQLLMKELKPKFFVGMRKDILQYLFSASGKHDLLDNINDILGELTDDSGTSHDDEDDGIGVGEDDSAIVRLANQIIVDSYKKGASDIHIEPYTARQDTMVRIRIDGRCQEYQRIPPSYRRALVSRIKIMARLDIAEKRKPQDGKIKFRLPTNRDIELRVATIPTAGGNEDVVMRILAASEPMPMEALKMTDRNLEGFKKIAANPYGLILVVGPTGSGKTTTLHSALGYINQPERKIWTAEDPVEITQYGLRQVQVQPRIGFTFAAAMRSFLRADPDVIMVGEMRDEETAHIGIEASLTGHLVFSTLHTNSAPETITRLLDMGLDPFNFGDALLGVLAQRLVRTLCSACKEPYNPPQATFDELRETYGPEHFDKLGIEYSPDFILQKAVGCSECSDLGYKGRVGIHELLMGSPEVKHLVQTRARMVDIRDCAMQEGMTSLLQDGILKIIEGLTDFTQVKAVAGSK